MLPPIAPAIRPSRARSRPLSRSSANRHPAISRSIQAFASRAIGTSPSHRDANGREASLFDTIDCYLRREQTMWVIESLAGLQLPTSSTSRRGGYSYGFDLRLDPIRLDHLGALKRLSTEELGLEESQQTVDPTGKDVGNCKQREAGSGAARDARRPPMSVK